MRRRVLAGCATVAALVALVMLLFPLYAVIVASFENNSQLFGATHYNFLPAHAHGLELQRRRLAQQGSHVLSSLIIGGRARQC